MKLSPASRLVIAIALALSSVIANLSVAAASSPGVDPQTVTATLDRGASTSVAKTVHTPPIPPKPDVLFLSDTTGSMGPTIANVRANAVNIMNTVISAQPDAQFGAADYKDAENGCPDPYEYRLDQAITANTGAVQAGINTWSAFGGCDTPEQQLNALFTLATNPATGFRSGSTRIVAWFGDSSGHDPSGGHTLAQVIAALQAAKIRVIAVPVNSGSGDGLDHTGQATAITSATGGVLLPSATPDQVSSAILSGLMNLPVTVAPQVGPCDPNLQLGFAPASRTVTSGQDAGFNESIAVGGAAPLGSTLSCTVTWLLNGVSGGPAFVQTITITTPQHATAVKLGGATTSDFNDPATLSATLTDSVTNTPLGGETIKLSIDGQSCTATTNGSGVGTCSITPNEKAGSYPLTASFAGDSQYLPSTSTGAFVVTLEETTLKYTGPTLIANGQPVSLSGVLLEDGTTPIAGRTVSFTLGTDGGAQTCNGPTDSFGKASCTINPVNQPLGPGAVSANFASDGFYKPASDSATTLLFAFLANGSFVVGDKSDTGAVTFWGAQWATSNALSGGAAPDSFKGFADTTSSPPACGQPWTTDPGNSSGPPDSIPSYMAVIVSSSVGKSGSTISGNTPSIVIVKTDPGYASNPGHAGTGSVVATFCP